MNNLQQDLLHFTQFELKISKLELKIKQSNKIRGVTAFWNELEETAYISFYLDGEVTKEDVEIASDICVLIISHLTKGKLKENYIRLDYPEPLPKSSFWAYKREEQ